MNMHNISCIDDNINIVRVGSSASIKKYAPKRCSVAGPRGNSRVEPRYARLGLGLLQASSKLDIGLSLARPEG